jgi:hypothetical protein
VHSSIDYGDFYRLLKEGIYDLVVSAPGYINDTLLSVAVTDYKATEVQVALVKDPKTGVGQYPGEPILKLYPNPASAYLYIGGSWGTGLIRDQVEIRIYSSHGVLYLQQEFESAQLPLPISISSLPKGYYILSISSGGFARSMGFVKQ